MLSIEDILGLPGIHDLPIEDALDGVGLLIDHAFDHSDRELADRALDWCGGLEGRELRPVHRALLDYFQANAWANRQAASRQDRAETWAWEQPELQKQVLYLRRALNNPAFESLETIRRCQILTNLANQLDTAGRFVEARAHWTRALEIDPEFWMARGNRGVGLMQYAKALYDRGHGAVFLVFAHRDLVKAVDSAPRYPHLGDAAVASYFHQKAMAIERIIEPSTVGKAYLPDGHALGDTPEEQSYRNWCLREILFLNPLNDLEARSIAARDVLTLPNFVTALSEPPILIGFFNEMKQEFVSARWTLYEAMHATAPHFSDRDVLLFNTLDYPAYGLATEKLKLAYRSAYSLFDKIAFFLNHYMSLGVAYHKISFRTIWREKDGAPISASVREVGELAIPRPVLAQQGFVRGRLQRFDRTGGSGPTRAAKPLGTQVSQGARDARAKPPGARVRRRSVLRHLGLRAFPSRSRTQKSSPDAARSRGPDIPRPRHAL